MSLNSFWFSQREHERAKLVQRSRAADGLVHWSICEFEMHDPDAANAGFPPMQIAPDDWADEHGNAAACVVEAGMRYSRRYNNHMTTYIYKTAAVTSNVWIDCPACLELMHQQREKGLFA
jgi:hypothetical protein